MGCWNTTSEKPYCPQAAKVLSNQMGVERLRPLLQFFCLRAPSTHKDQGRIKSLSTYATQPWCCLTSLCVDLRELCKAHVVANAQAHSAVRCFSNRKCTNEKLTSCNVVWQRKASKITKHWWQYITPGPWTEKMYKLNPAWTLPHKDIIYRRLEMRNSF